MEGCYIFDKLLVFFLELVELSLVVVLSLMRGRGELDGRGFAGAIVGLELAEQLLVALVDRLEKTIKFVQALSLHWIIDKFIYNKREGYFYEYYLTKVVYFAKGPSRWGGGSWAGCWVSMESVDRMGDAFFEA